MKKATTKRERKYGKKDITDDRKVKTTKKGHKKKEQDKEVPVQVMVDYAYIMDFKSKTEANEYITKKNKEAEEKLRTKPSFTFI